MDADAGAFWIRFTKSAAFLALGAAAHVWLLPSTRSARVTDELAAVGAPAGFVLQPADPRAASTIAMLESTNDDLAGAPPRAPLAPQPAPVATSGRVIVAVEKVAASSIFDRPRPQSSSAQQLASADTTMTSAVPEAVGTTGIGGPDAILRTAGTLGTLGTPGTVGTERTVGTPETAELQVASDALSSARRPAYETLAVATPTTVSDTPQIAVNARQLLDDEQMVRRVLQQYRTAYEQLDAAAAKSVWPSVDERALTHAFQQLSAQRLTFRSCGISIRGVGANARCRGEAEYLPKIGAKRAYTASGEWVFDLTREQTAWRIVNASVH